MSLSGVGIQTLKDVNSLQLILGRLNWLNVEYRLKKHWRLPCFTLRRLDLRGLFSIEHSFLWWFPLDVFFSSKQNLKKTQFRYKRICHFFCFCEVSSLDASIPTIITLCWFSILAISSLVRFQCLGNLGCGWIDDFLETKCFTQFSSFLYLCSKGKPPIKG